MNSHLVIHPASFVCRLHDFPHCQTQACTRQTPKTPKSKPVLKVLTLNGAGGFYDVLTRRVCPYVLKSTFKHTQSDIHTFKLCSCDGAVCQVFFHFNRSLHGSATQ